MSNHITSFNMNFKIPTESKVEPTIALYLFTQSYNVYSITRQSFKMMKHSCTLTN